MKTLALVALFLATSGHAISEPKNPIGRYFRRVPIERAHITWGAAPEGTLPDSSLDVLVWNVKKGDRGAFAEEFRKFSHGKDVFLVQEAYTAQYFIDSLEELRDYQWDVGISFTYKLYNNYGTGNMIGAHVRPVWVKVEHTEDLEPLTGTPKTTAYAKYAIGSEKTVLVISIHGINFKNFNAFSRHLAQVRRQIDLHQGPVILAGDFNTRTKERYREVQAFAASLAMTEVSFKNDHLRMTAVGTKNYLDHAFIRGFTIKEAEVHSSPGSDHKPMTMELDLQ